MSKADEMFEKMGYKKSYQKSIYNKVWGILYKNEKSMINISFDMGNDGESDYEEAHMVCVYIQAFDERTEPAYITMQELQAINEKVKELRLVRRKYMSCKAKSNPGNGVKERGKASIEYYKDGKPQYYCYGYIDEETDELIDECRECPEHVYKAQED